MAGNSGQQQATWTQAWLPLHQTFRSSIERGPNIFTNYWMLQRSIRVASLMPHTFEWPVCSFFPLMTYDYCWIITLAMNEQLLDHLGIYCKFIWQECYNNTRRILHHLLKSFWFDFGFFTSINIENHFKERFWIKLEWIKIQIQDCSLVGINCSCQI